MDPDHLPPLDLNLNLIRKNTDKALEYGKLKREIRPLVHILQSGPETELEKIIFNDDPVEEDSESVNLNIQKSKELLKELQEKVEAQKSVEKALWDQILTNHTLMGEKYNPGLEYSNTRRTVIDAMRKLLHEQIVAQERKNYWISTNILEIRKELEEMWSQCLVSDDEATRFPGFTAINFSEELLELHVSELKKWKLYKAKNQTLFDQIEKRSSLWTQMVELHAKSQDPARFVNRGGTLLKSQNEMNFVTKTLPRVEEKLILLAKDFEKENRRKLLIAGKSIPKMIEDDWTEFKEKTRKKPVETCTTTHNVPIGLRSVQQNVLYKSRRDIAEGILKTAKKRNTMMPMVPPEVKRVRLDQEFVHLETENSSSEDL